MKNGLNEAGGWAPVGEDIAGTRDVLTGAHELTRPPSKLAGTLQQLTAVATATATIAALYFGQGVLVPITLAVMLSFILAPVVKLLQRLRFWRVPAVIITVLAALGIFGAIGTLIGSQAASLSVNAPQYASAIEAKVEALQGFSTARLESITKALGGGPRQSRPPSVARRDQLSPRDGATVRPPILVEVAPPKTTPLSVAKTILEPIVGPLETTFIVLMVAVFVLMQREDLRDRFIRVFGAGDLHRTTMALDDAGKRLSRYFIAQLAVNTTFGIVIAFALWLFGVPSPAMWGVVAGLLRFVPYIGPVLAALAPVALGAAIDPGWSLAIYIALMFVAVESLVGYVIEPLLYGHSTGLSPVSVIVSAIFWTFLWGPVGLVLSTPLTLCLVVLGRHVKALEFFDVILGDRPALTAVETFYQRILAGNADEALAEAETMLGDRTLLEYYDEIVLAALRMAARDEARGMIDGVKAVAMTQTMLAVIQDLGSQENDSPSAVQSSAPRLVVTCVAGRGPFDTAVASVLQHMLGLRGFATDLVTNQSAARGAIAQLDLTASNIIVISYLELAGVPAELRFLIRRLRQKAPEARIIVGLWPDGEEALSDGAVQQALGADDYVKSLRGAVELLEDPHRSAEPELTAIAVAN